MKFYSEILDTMYDTIEELQGAEAVRKKADNERANRVAEIEQMYLKCRKKMDEIEAMQNEANDIFKKAEQMNNDFKNAYGKLAFEWRYDELPCCNEKDCGPCDAKTCPNETNFKTDVAPNKVKIHHKEIKNGKTVKDIYKDGSFDDIAEAVKPLLDSIFGISPKSYLG